MSLGIALGTFISYKSSRFRIIVSKDVLKVYPIFSKSYTFNFDDIISVVRQTKKYYQGNKREL